MGKDTNRSKQIKSVIEQMAGNVSMVLFGSFFLVLLSMLYFLFSVIYLATSVFFGQERFGDVGLGYTL